MPEYGLNSNYHEMDSETADMVKAAMAKLPASAIDNYKKHAERTSDFARTDIRILWGYNKDDYKMNSKDDKRVNEAYYLSIPTVIYGE